MAKSFTHDYHARENLAKLQMALGLEGIGAYWCLVEMMHERCGEIPVDEIECIAFSMHCSPQLVESIVFDFDLFSIDEGLIRSRRVRRNLKSKEAVSDTRRAAAERRWHTEPKIVTGRGFEDGGCPITPPKEETPSKGEKTAPIDDVGKTKGFILDRLDKLEPKPFSAQETDYFFVYPILRHIVSSIKGDVTISGDTVPISDYLSALQHYTQNINNLISARPVIESGKEKPIANKLAYITSALYLNAKIEGG